MRAIGYTATGDPSVLTDVELPEPSARGRDLLVEVRAISVNPIDTKVRRRAAAEPGQVKVLGWDVAGVVRSVGPDVTMFAPGEEVWYAGSLVRAGANSELHLVDERIAAGKPASLDFPAAAAMPLTSITAWELLFDRLGAPREGGQGQTLLIVGAAGGVGSMLTQLAARLTGLTVVGTASRTESAAWVSSLGADHVVDHSAPLGPQLAELGIDGVELIASLTHTDEHFAQLVEVLAPQGRIGLIDDPQPIDVRVLKPKAASLHWESMFTRSTFGTPDLIEQHNLLTEVARLVDDGVLRSTSASVSGPITAARLRAAHEFVESGRAVGKVVLAGWPT